VKAQVLLHVRVLPNGPAIVTPVSFADLACEAATVAAAVDHLQPSLRDRLGSLEAVDRLPFAVEPEATLLRVPIEVEVGGKGGETVEIALGIVAVQRRVRGRAVVVGHVPVLPDFETVNRDGNVERLITQMTPRLAKRLRSWSAVAVLNADEPNDSRLDVIEVDVEEGIAQDDHSDAASDGGILEELGVDLTSRAGARFDGRDELVARVLETLAASDRSSVLLVGPPDVGKTALIHELSRRIETGAAPPALVNRRVWRVSANELIAGAIYTGQWQERVQRLIKEARRTRPVVVMGDPIGIASAGRWSGSDNNVSRYLRPYVESGEVTIVCEATPDQLAAALKQEPSFINALHRVDVAEPTREDTRRIVTTAAARLAAEASLSVEADAVDAALELTGRFEPYRSFPGKAIRLFEDAIRERKNGNPQLDRAALTAAFSRRSGMPLALLSDSLPLRIADVRTHFETRVLGQPDATAALVDVVSVLKAGLNDPQKPLGSLFFVGPTGVGKTESAKALAELLFGSRDRLVRFDMGEYVANDAVLRLIGTPWGSDEGELTRRVREQPFCVVLLDEIEKAHWSVFDALLAAIGEGRLTDAAGRVADFRNAIVIMTSNLGARRLRASPLGFAGAPANGADERYIEEAERFFRPEFFNRIDRVVVFHPLSQHTVREIARRELDRLLMREGILRRQLLVELDDAVVEHVASSGFHPRYGARPLQRAIERLVLEPLARLLVERKPEQGGFVRVHLTDGSVAVDFERVKEPPSTARHQRRAVEEEATFARSERLAMDFAQRLATHEASVLAEDVRAIVSGLIDSTHERSFWDDAARARSTLQRIYQLEHLLDRLEALHVRAAGLIELARRLRETQNRARLGEIRSACDEMEDVLVVLRLELAAAATGSQGGDAVLRVIPVGNTAAAWAERLLAMYVAWAERTAREATRSSDDPLALTISGPATLDLLKGEAGLHRHVRPEGKEVHARVVVNSSGATSEHHDHDPGAVVRVYEEGKRRVVRDPRTGMRESHLRHVLEEGRIDAFLIAALRASGIAPEDDRPGPGADA
jgi:ATP-dependent Clp protease ATP-binding subunit ClpA